MQVAGIPRNRLTHTLVWITVALFGVIICTIVIYRPRSGADSPRECAVLFIRSLRDRDDVTLRRVASPEIIESVTKLNTYPEWPETSLHDLAEARHIRLGSDMWPALQVWAGEIPESTIQPGLYRNPLTGKISYIYTPPGEIYQFRITKTMFGTRRITDGTLLVNK